MTALQRMINEAKAEHAAQWAVAIAGNQQVNEWAAESEAQKANPGFSFRAFWKNDRGMWQCA